MSSPEEQIRQIREDLTAQNTRLTSEIQKKLDKDKLSFLVEKDKNKQAEQKTFEASLKQLISTEVEKAGQSVWKPDSRWYKTPEFMGFVSALTGAAIGGTLASMGLTFVKYDFALFDLTEKVNRAILRVANHVTKRDRWQDQFRTSQHKAELELNRRFHDLDHRLSRRIKDVAKKLNKRIDGLDRRVAENTRARRNVQDARDRVRTVAASPGTIPSTRTAAAELNELHTRIDQLVAALG
ncbi:hypothetical protein [Streptomyces lancefieldiae]|uniref:Uncharacterized protein n=1 Tax=Streptomyces lancefieldiae TaxID=3075520 RepID=A0ABU3AIU0_9ACTN|nr:hypothetical protein [Streptomyces sp. DSM 40712]MDT0610107.1 hypothetical protein [Streptomyces sp. DSM 40712]